MAQNFYYCNRVVYGSYKAYPVNQVAHQFAKLLGVKTFSKSELDQISDLGFAVNVVSDPKAPPFEPDGPANDR